MLFINVTLAFFAVFLTLVLATALTHLYLAVPYVPSKKSVIKKMIQAAGLKKNDTVYDLGCGDGRLLIAAEKKAKVKSIGFEIAPLVYLLARLRTLIMRSRAQVRFANFFNANLRQANVIFCYLFPNILPNLAKKIKKECKRGTRVISNTFRIPGLKLTKMFAKNPKKGLPTIYVYKI